MREWERVVSSAVVDGDWFVCSTRFRRGFWWSTFFFPLTNVEDGQVITNVDKLPLKMGSTWIYNPCASYRVWLLFWGLFLSVATRNWGFCAILWELEGSLLELWWGRWFMGKLFLYSLFLGWTTTGVEYSNFWPLGEKYMSVTVNYAHFDKNFVF